MSVPYIIGFVSLLVLQLIATCIFLKIEIPKPSKKSLILKSTCSTIFLLTAVLSMICANNFSSYAWFILAGLAFSWVETLYSTTKLMKIFSSQVYLSFFAVTSAT